MVIIMEEKDFSMRLTKLRMEKGVSARDMSLSIGQNAGYINSIESGRTMPSLAGFYYICEYLGITPSEFFDTESENPSRLNDIIKDMKYLSDKQLDVIELLVKELMKK